MSNKTALKRIKIKKRIRKVVYGSSTKPRLTVYRSNKEIYAQLIDDTNSKTIVAASSKDRILKSKQQIKLKFQRLLVIQLVKKLLKPVLKKFHLTEMDICTTDE